MAIPTMANNTPSSGRITWGAFTIQLNGVNYSVGTGSTADRWVWWKYNAGAPSLQSGAEIPLTLVDDDLVLFGNKNGIGVRVQSTNFIDGELMVDGSIFADALSTNLINTNHIVTAGLNASVIKFGEMSGDRLAVNTLQGDRILAKTIGVGKLIVGDFNNYIADGDVSDPTMSSWRGGTLSRVAVVGDLDYLEWTAGNGSNMHIYNENKFELRPGDSFVFIGEASTPTQAGTVTVFPAIQTETADGAISTWAQSSGTVLPSNSAWTPIKVTIVIPAGTSRSGVFDPFASGSGPGLKIRLRGMFLQKKSNGELIVDGSVKAINVAANAIEADKIKANAVTADKVEANAITTDKIAANAVTANEIKADTITANEIATNAITANEIAANAVTADKVEANAITAIKIAANAIESDKIKANAITTDKLDSKAITTELLLADNALITGILSVKETVSEAVSTAGLSVGPNISITEADGLVFRSPEGDTTIPANGQKPSFSGEAVFKALTTKGDFKIEGTTNELAKGAVMRLGTGTTAPKGAPVGSSFWPSKPIHEGAFSRGLARHNTTGRYYSAESAGGATISWCGESAEEFGFGYSSTFISGTDDPGGGAWNKPEVTSALGGVAFLGDNMYALCQVTEAVPGTYYPRWYVYQGSWNVATQKWLYVRRWLYEPSNILGGYSTHYPAIGVRESTSQVIIGQSAKSNDLWVTTYSNVGASIGRAQVKNANGTVFYPGKSSASCDIVSADFGTEQLVVVLQTDETARVFHPTTYLADADKYFPLPTSGPVGATFDGSVGKFRTRSKNTVYDHTNILSSTVSAVMTWRKRNEVAPEYAEYETDKSRMWLTTTFPKRAALMLNAGLIPDDITDPNDPDSVSFYVALNDTSGANTSLRRQLVPALGVAKMAYSSLTATGDVPPTSPNFPEGSPARILSSDGVLVDIRGSGEWRLGDISGDQFGRVRGGAFVPIGGAIPFFGTTVPVGWLMLDGGTASETVHPLLVQHLIDIGAPYGGPIGSRVVTLPDARDRFISGAGTARPVLQTGGSDTVTMPDHTHPVPAHGHGNSFSLDRTMSGRTTGGLNTVQLVTLAGGVTANAGFNTGAVNGTNPSISNIPKYLSANYIIRAA